MKGTPYISVIVPVYNSEKTLPACLAALKGQKDFDDYEVIVVDDASTDGSLSISEASSFKVVKHEFNMGAARARNRGARKARGEVLVFVDADVALKDCALKNIADFFEQRPEIDAAVGTYSDETPLDNFASIYHNYFTFYHHDLSSFDIEWFWGAIGVVRRKVFESAGGFDERFTGASAEDLDFGYTLSRQGRRIAYLRTACGDHLHRFSFRSMLFNDYRKAVLGIKLYMTRKTRDRHEHGFSNPRNAVALVMVYILMFCIACSALGHVGQLTVLVCVLALLGVNWPFYKFIARRSHTELTLAAILLHWLSFVVIGLGVIMGLVGLMMGRNIYSRSPWI